jgi:hypothetical protein
MAGPKRNASADNRGARGDYGSSRIETRRINPPLDRPQGQNHVAAPAGLTKAAWRDVGQLVRGRDVRRTDARELPSIDLVFRFANGRCLIEARSSQAEDWLFFAGPALEVLGAAARSIDVAASCAGRLVVRARGAGLVVEIVR